MPATTVSMSSDRLRKMSKRSRFAEPICAVISAPPTPAMAADSMNTDSLSVTMLWPSVADAAGLSFMAVSRRP